MKNDQPQLKLIPCQLRLTHGSSVFSRDFAVDVPLMGKVRPGASTLFATWEVALYTVVPELDVILRNVSMDSSSLILQVTGLRIQSIPFFCLSTGQGP